MMAGFGGDGLPAAGEWVLAIDFGTTNTVAAVTDARGTKILRVGERLVRPSAVFLNPDGKTLLTGDSAISAGRRRLGWFEPNPKRGVAGGGLFIGGRNIPVREAIAAVLSPIVQEAASQQGGRRPGAFVVTHPVNWDQALVEVLVDAAAAAAGQGWPRPRPLSEPVAAAQVILGREDIPRQARLVVLDLGGGTVDAAVVDRDGDIVTVAGVPQSRDDVGGEDYDVRLARWMVAEAGTPGLYDRLAASEEPGKRERAAEIRADACGVKQDLSFRATAAAGLPQSPPGLPEITPVIVSRTSLEALIRGGRDHDPGLAESVELASIVLGAAPPGPPFVGVLLTGGGARIPMLAVLAQELSGRPPLILGSPDTAVAQGAAQLAWQALAWAPAAVADVRPSSPAGPVVDEDVRFTVYRPESICPGYWASLLVFAHKTSLVAEPGHEPVDPMQEVEARARAHFGNAVPRPAGADANREVARGTQLRIVPDLPGIRCNPREAEIEWWEPVHEAPFRLLADPGLAGTVVRGAVRVWCDHLIFGEVSIAIRIAAGAPAPETPPVIAPLTPYRKIFASYSHQDRVVVDSFAEVARALGDQYLQDVLALRAGERWDARLLELIEDADVFQLFWSGHSMRSPHCREEWEHALGLRRPLFIRPVYWEDPLPADPGQELPPATLRVLHFVKVPALQPGASPPERAGQALAPASDAPLILAQEPITRRDNFEDLAQTAAGVLVSAIATDSWEAVKRRFAAVVGHERQLDATRAELAASHGPERAQAQAELAQAWATRLRDVLEDQPGLAPDLLALVASLGAVPGPTVTQRAGRGSVNVSGDNRGEVHVGVGQVDKRRFKLRLSPLLFFGQAVAARPLVATVVTVVVALGGVSGGVALSHKVTHAAGPSPVAGRPGAPPANLVLNGGFAEPACSSVCEVEGGSTGIPHWTVGGNSVDIISSSYFEPAAGSQSADLSGAAPGTLTQTATTTAGSTYRLRWHMAGNPVCGQQVKTMDVYWDGVLSDTLKFSTSVHTVKSMGWVTRQITVTASSSASSIEFADATPDHSQCGVTLDEVSLVRT
jgi:choice-of-anchor C domain-containing protein